MAAIEKQIEIRTPDGIADGLVYQPDAGKGPWPGVLHQIRRAHV